MPKRATEELLGELHEAVASKLLEKVKSGEATPAEISAAIKFLQNNGIEAVIGKGETSLDKLAAALPTFDEDDHEGYVN
jgi:carbamate kinase